MTPRRAAIATILFAVLLGLALPVTAGVSGLPNAMVVVALWVAAAFVMQPLVAFVLVRMAVREVTAKVIASNNANRAKQSRHEYHHGRALARLEASVAALSRDADITPPRSPAPRVSIPWSDTENESARVLFVTSNGSGMGHITRCLAMSASAAERGVSTAVLTLSTAYKLVREAGTKVLYYPSPDSTVWRRDVWNRRFASYLLELMTFDTPDVVVFDGTAVYRGLTQACRQLGIPLVWMRREMWKVDVDRSQFDSPFTVADYVLVPGDVGSAADPRQGEVEYLDPIVGSRRESALDPREARAALGLDPDGRYAVVQTGKATFDGQPIVTSAVRAIRSLEADIEPVVLVSPVAATDDECDGVRVVVGRYPVAPYLRAFEFAVCAAGYNTVHENLELGIPAVYTPQVATLTDDQDERARRIEAHGWGLRATDPGALEEAVRRLGDNAYRHAMAMAIKDRPESCGADDAVEMIADIARRHRQETALIMGGEPTNDA